MLVLSRKVGEAIVIPLVEGEVVITVLEVRADRVRLGFEAPPEIPINRGEVMAAIRADGNGRVRVEPGHSVARSYAA